MVLNAGKQLANSIDPDLSAPQEHSDQGLHCLCRAYTKQICRLNLVLQRIFNIQILFDVLTLVYYLHHLSAYPGFEILFIL